jgi:hypothetical protein
VITTENFWLWFGGIWLAVGLSFLIIGGAIGFSSDGRALDARLQAQGTRVEGTVLAKEIVSQGDSPRYRVTFRFEDANGAAVRGTADVDAAAWDALAERGPIEITYLADQPGTYRVPGQTRGDEAVLALVLPFVGAVVGAIGGALVVTALRTRRVRRELLRSGSSAAASVLEVGPSGLSINGVPQWKVRYRFRDASGREHEGKCAVAPEEGQRWRQGAVGRVRYDAGNPRSQVWTGERS